MGGDIGPNVFGGGGVLGTGLLAGPEMPGASKSEKALSQIALAQWNEAKPFRQEWAPLLMKVLEGNTPASAFPAFAPLRTAAEAQYGVAKNNLMGSVPRGGELTSALTNLEANRAQTVGSLGADFLTDLLNKSFGVAYNAPQAAMSGLSSAGAMAAQRQAAQLQAQQAKGAGLGQTAGMLGAAYLLAPEAAFVKPL